MSRKLLVVSSLALVLALILGGSPSTAKKKAIEQYEANALAIDGPAGSKSSVIHFNIYKWSSDEDREEVQDAIQEATENKRAYRAVPEALRKLGKAGYMFLAGGQGWPIRYAREFNVDGKREILLATDRPVTFSPPNHISPPDTVSRPEMMRSSVVLPHPDGPSSVVSVPASNTTLISSSAVTSSKRLEMFFNVIVILVSPGFIFYLHQLFFTCLSTRDRPVTISTASVNTSMVRISIDPYATAIPVSPLSTRDRI